MRPISTRSTTMVAEPPFIAQPRSPWHSPVPYLFGGLAAMLGLIAFALLILACSYWKLSAAGRSSDTERDIENGNENERSSNSERPDKVYEEKYLVIMAGNEKPTFIATAVSSKACLCKDEKKVDKRGEKVENGEKVGKEEMGSSQQDQAQEGDH